MAATMLIREKNGAGETATDKTSGTIRMKNADNAINRDTKGQQVGEENRRADKVGQRFLKTGLKKQTKRYGTYGKGRNRAP